MQVGSLVGLVKPLVNRLADKFAVTLPVMGKIYTVRDIQKFEMGVAILLVEIHNQPIKFVEGFQEPYFPIEKFSELLPPKEHEISELLEQPQYA